MVKFIFSALLALIGIHASATPLNQTDLQKIMQNNNVVILVDSSIEGTRATSQTLTLLENGAVQLMEPISSGRANHQTRNGEFKPQDLYKEHYVSGLGIKIENVIRFDLPVQIYGLNTASALGKQSTLGGIKTTIQTSQQIFEAVRNNFRSSVLIVYQ